MSRLHGTACQRQCGSIATKLSRLDACKGWKVVCWCRTQASSHNSQGVVDGGVDEAGMSTPAPQPKPASRLRNATRDVSFLRCDSRCWRYVSDLSNVTPRYLGSEQKGRISLLCLTLSSRLASLLLRWKAADTVFVVLSFSFQTRRYSSTIAMSLVRIPSTACQSPSACMIARSSAYAYFLETVVDRSEM